MIRCENTSDVNMGRYCKKCGKIMKKSEITHCSDECLFASIIDSISINKKNKDASFWDEKTDPWK